MRERVRRAAVTGAGLSVLAMAALSFAFATANGAADDLGFEEFLLVISFLSLPLVGAALLWLRPGQAVARCLLASGLLVTASQVAVGWAYYTLRTHPGRLPGGWLAAWLAAWLVVPGFGLGPFVLLLFPSGTVRRVWLRRFAVAAAGAVVLVAVAQAVAPGPIDGGPSGVLPINNPAGVEALRGWSEVATSVGVTLVLALFVLAVVDLLVRLRRAGGIERQQLRWVAAAGAILPATVVVVVVLELLGLPSDWALTLGQIGFLFGLSAAIAVAVLRHRLYDLDVVINRSLVYAGLTAFVALGYVAVVSLIGLLVRGSTGALASLVATGAVALAFQPARSRIQRAVDRLVHGDSAEPYTTLVNLGDRLAGSLDPGAVPGVLVDTVADALRLPYVALVVGGQEVARRGTPVSGAQSLPVVQGGEVLGTLVVATRPSHPLRPVEERLLGDLVQQAGAPLRIATLSSEVARARDLAVAAREEERRRIRRDLHDGVGPALAGLALHAGTLRQQLRGEAAQPAVERLEAGLEEVLAEVRRLAHGLRPPALDALGLREALVQLCDSFTRPGLSVRAELPVAIPPLPAATEVAVLRIAAEGLANVAHHAGDCRAVLRLRAEGRIVLEIEDDGVGGATYGAGMGLRSMAERAEEVGGSCRVVPGLHGGTTVRADLGEVA